MKRFILFVFIHVFISIPMLLKGQVNEQDSLALVDLYNSTDGPNWTDSDFDSWLTTTRLQSWAGVKVENGRVTELDLEYHITGFLKPRLNGTIPESIGNLTELKHLGLSGINGAIPSSIGNLTKLEYLNISAHCTGTIPESIGNLRLLKKLIINGDLTGYIPESIGNDTSLTVLSFRSNELTGAIPTSIGNLKNLTNLSLNDNNLSGEIPETISNLHKLTRLDLSRNELTGNIPKTIDNLVVLEKLYLNSNNLDGLIPDKIGGLTALNELNLNSNNINGEIPESFGKLTSIQILKLENNNLTGAIPGSISKLNNLNILSVSCNSLSDSIPIELCNCINLDFFSVEDNILTFDKIEKFAMCNTNQNFRYGNQFKFCNQEYLEFEGEKVGDSIRLIFNQAGGEYTNEFIWSKKNQHGVYETITTTTTNSYNISKSEDHKLWRCTAKNSLLPNLELIGLPPERITKECWQTGLLTFCLSKNNWEKIGNTNKIKATDLVSINDILYFDGTITIDTLTLDMQADGDFFAKDIQLPGEENKGDYLLSSGEHNLKLLGKDGKITNFLNSKLSKSAKLFGVALKIDNLQLVKRSDTLGINVACTASIPGAVVGCDELKTSDFALRNLEITDFGITLGGFSVENLGIPYLGGCLKKFTIDYDSKKDIIVAGTEITLPFLPADTDIGAGVKIEKGEIDSIAWLLDTDLGVIPISPPLTFGVRGFEGYIASINKPNIDIKIKGIFSDLLTNKVYKVSAGGRTIWPKIFELEGTGQFLKPPLFVPYYQLKGDVLLGLDVPNTRLYINFDGQCGTIDEKKWLIDGVGNFNISLQDEAPPIFSGNIEGLLSLPKLSDSRPFSWFGSLFDIFPIEMRTNNKFSERAPTHIFGIASVKTKSFPAFSLKYRLDIEKNWYQPGYFILSNWEENKISGVITEKSGQVSGTVSKTFTIPENNEFGVIEIKSNVKTPVSSITSPKGKKYSATSFEDNILYTEQQDKNVVFWTMLSADEGEWTITLTDPEQNDSIITFFQLKDQEFKFSMNQSGDKVEVSWDIARISNGQSIYLMLDNNDVDFDGFKVAECDASFGSLSFILDENTPDCSYHLYVQLVDDFEIIESYSDEEIKNPLASLAPPTNFNSTYNTETGDLKFSWEPSPSSDIIGYVLSVTDELGNDSVYAILNSNQTSIPLFIEDFETKSAKIESYNNDWKIGCPQIINNLTTSIDENLQIQDPVNKLNIFPNPTNGNLTIRYFISEPSKCEIMVFDINGRRIANPFSGHQSPGFHQVDFNYTNYPNGIYLIKFVNKKESFTIKSILNN